MTDTPTQSTQTSVLSVLKTWGLGQGAILALIILGIGAYWMQLGTQRSAWETALMTGVLAYYGLSILYSLALAIYYGIKRQWLGVGLVLMAMGGSVVLAFGLCCGLLMIH